MFISVTTLLRTQNIILHFSQSKILSKTYMIQTQGPSGSLGLLFSSCLPTSLNSTLISQLAVTSVLHEYSFFLDLAFSIPENAGSHCLYVSRLFLVQVKSCVGLKVVGVSA